MRRRPTSLLKASLALAITITITACNGAVVQAPPTALTPGPMATGRGGDILYVTTGAQTGSERLFRYAWPQLTKIGSVKVPGSGVLTGDCVDHEENVFVLSEEPNKIFEYAHGGSMPTTTLTDGAGEPWACAVDQTNGHVAVTNFSCGSLCYPGNVLILRMRSSIWLQTTYQVPNMWQPLYLAYDEKGDLFVDGVDNSGFTVLDELANGKSSFAPVYAANPPLGDMQWDGQYLAIATLNQYPTSPLRTPGSHESSIDRFAISGSHAYLKSTTVYDSLEAPGEFVLYKPRIGSTQVAISDSRLNDIGIWPYYKGGAPVTTVHVFGPFGAAISY